MNFVSEAVFGRIGVVGWAAGFHFMVRLASPSFLSGVDYSLAMPVSRPEPFRLVRCSVLSFEECLEMMAILKMLWADEDGAIFASEWILMCTLLISSTIVGIFIVRTAALKLFVNVSVGIAKQQVHPFDVSDAGTDMDDDGYFRYRKLTAAAFSVPGDGETPAEINLNSPAPEGGSPF